MKSPTPGWSLLCRNKHSPISSFCGSWDIMPRCCLWAPAQSAAATVCLLCYQEAENLVATVVPTNLAAAVPEVAVYLKESVGNSTRIDYGTGTCDPRRRLLASLRFFLGLPPLCSGLCGMREP